MSYQDLLAILKERREDHEDDRRRPVVDCPLCGEILEENKGAYNCPMGHYRTTNPKRDY